MTGNRRQRVHLGAILRELREEQRLSLPLVAMRLRTSKRGVEMIEAGRHEITFYQLTLFAKLFGTTSSEIARRVELALAQEELEVAK